MELDGILEVFALRVNGLIDNLGIGSYGFEHIPQQLQRVAGRCLAFGFPKDIVNIVSVRDKNA